MFKEILGLFVKPVANIFSKREERKAARESAKAKLTAAKVQNQYDLELTDQEWEAISAKGLQDSWRDEYVTVSIMSVLNLVVIGGVASAFGYPQVLEGTGVAVSALSNAGLDMGFLMEATVLAGLGLSVWRRA